MKKIGISVALSILLATGASEVAAASDRTSAPEGSDTSFVVVQRDANVVIIRATEAELRRARQLANGGPVLLARTAGQSYLIRDPKVLAEVDGIYGPLRSSSQAQQRVFQKTQEELSKEREQLSERLARQSGQFDGRVRRAAPGQRDTLEKERVLIQKHSALANEHSAYAAEHSRLAAVATEKVAALVQRAIESGVAQKVGS